MKGYLKHIIIAGCLLATFAEVNAQVLAKMSVDRDKILIGEPIKLTLDVRVPLGQSITWFSLDTIPHFEFLDKGKVDTTDDIDGKKIQQTLTITSYDSGQWAIQPLVLKVDAKPYYTDSVLVDVAYTPYDPAADYHDIKDIKEVSLPWWSKYIPWLIGSLTLIAIVVIIFLLRKPRKQAPVETIVVSKLSPYEEAIKSLDELKGSIQAQNGQIKVFYSRLNDILRLFIFRKLNIATLEKTNDELVTQLKRLPLDKDTYNQLSEALRMTDFVKFARYQPGVADNEKNYRIIRSAITSLNNIE